MLSSSQVTEEELGLYCKEEKGNVGEEICDR